VNKAVLLAVSFAGLVLSGTATLADSTDSAAPAATGTDPSKPDPDRIVCRTGAPVVGTRLGAKRECATQREWDQRQADAQKLLSDTQTHTFTQGH
jgi:hypothetical protein